MSKYYNINGLKVRVSDHEPNEAMNRFRGANDIEFYTVSASNSKLSVIAQIEKYCDKKDVDINLFKEIIKDFPDEKYTPSYQPEEIEVSQDLVDGYLAISGKGSMRRKERFCEKNNIDEYKMSQGLYKIKKIGYVPRKNG